MKKISILLFIFTFFLFIAPAQAATFKSNQQIVIPKGQTINESVYAGGQTIEIDGDVNGDVICGAQTVRIAGNISGDVICGAQTINISGHVSGNIRAAGQSINIANGVDRNVNLFGQEIVISSNSAILGEALIMSQDARIDGSIAKKLSGGMQSVTINGTVGDVEVQVENITVAPMASIKNNLVYTSPNTLNISNNDIVSGKIVRHAVKPSEIRTQNRREWANRFIGTSARLTSLFIQIILALVIVAFLPKRIRDAALLMQQKVGLTFGWGLLVLILTPIATLLLLVTILGIPLGIILIFIFVVAIFIGRILTGFVIGKMLLERFWVHQKENEFWTVVIGVVALWIIYSIPVIGGVLSVLGLIFGLGGVYYLLRPGTTTTVKKE